MKSKLKENSQAAIKYGKKLAEKGTKTEGDEGGNSSKEVLEDGIEATDSIVSNAERRKRIQRQNAKKLRKQKEKEEASSRFSPTKRFVDKAGADISETIKERLEEFFHDHPVKSILIALIALIVMFMVTNLNACSVMSSSFGTVTMDCSYTANDRDILAVESKYRAKEKALQRKVDTIETTYPGYDEYRYNVDGIGHDPFELAALLTVLYEDYTQREVQEAINTIFNYQYEFRTQRIVEVRYRTETRTGTRDITRANGEVSTESYTYTVQVPYNYYILQVTLKNNGINKAKQALVTDEELSSRYDIVLSLKGNKPEIFGNNIYSLDEITEEYEDYDVPPEMLSDQQFANMLREGERYLGYPYVWGGSNPDESFDCSGFVCYVINHCGNGWNLGRTTANGLKNATARVRASDVKAGDLIFFKGTYSTSGASHVGIVVDPVNKIMLHCGSPIQYASYDTAYWRAHFYCYGRIQ